MLGSSVCLSVSVAAFTLFEANCSSSQPHFWIMYSVPGTEEHTPAWSSERPLLGLPSFRFSRTGRRGKDQAPGTEATRSGRIIGRFWGRATAPFSLL